MKARFLALDEVIGLHVDQIERYGGAPGVRDLGLLESAVATPKASFGGPYLHGTLPEMAAAYWVPLLVVPMGMPPRYSPSS